MICLIKNKSWWRCIYTHIYMCVYIYINRSMKSMSKSYLVNVLSSDFICFSHGPLVYKHDLIHRLWCGAMGNREARWGAGLNPAVAGHKPCSPGPTAAACSLQWTDGGIWAPWVSLQVTLNWVRLSVCLRVRRLLRGTWTDWTHGLRSTVWDSTGPRARSQQLQPGLGQSVWELPAKEEPEGASCHEPAVSSGGQAGHQLPGLDQQSCGQQEQDSDRSLSWALVRLHLEHWGQFWLPY